MKKRSLILSSMLLSATTVLASTACVPATAVYAQEAEAIVSEEEILVEDEVISEEVSDETEEEEIDEAKDGILDAEEDEDEKSVKKNMKDRESVKDKNKFEVTDEDVVPEEVEEEEQDGKKNWEDLVKPGVVEDKRPEEEAEQDNKKNWEDLVKPGVVEDKIPEGEAEQDNKKDWEDLVKPGAVEDKRPEEIKDTTTEKDSDKKVPEKDEEVQENEEEDKKPGKDIVTPEVDAKEDKNLDSVEDLKVKDITKNKIVLKWDKVGGAAGYKVYRRASKNGEWELVKTTSKDTYTDKKLKTGAAYEYQVVAYAEDGTESEQGEVLETATKPQKPTLKLKKAEKNTVKLTWNKSIDADKVVVYMKTGKGKFKKIAVKDASAGSFTKKLEAGKKYSFRIVACTEAGEEEVFGAYSSTQNIKIK